MMASHGRNIHLVHYLGLDALAVHLIPAGWHYETDADHYIQIHLVRSAVLAASGILDPQGRRARCHPDHWILRSEVDQQTLAAERARRTCAALLSESLHAQQMGRSSLGRQTLREAALHHPQLVAQILDLSDSHRTPRAIQLASALGPEDACDWLDLVRAAVAREPGTRRTVNGIDKRYLTAFKTTDSPAAREVWDSLLDDIENDAELIQLVVAAMQGQGSDWLKSCARLDPGSIPHQQLRSATLAAMIGASSEYAAIVAASQSHAGWIAEGFKNALALYESDQLAQAWYRRFRAAQTWSEAWGCWHMQCQWVDLRQRLWDGNDLPAHALPDAARFEEDFHRDVKNAIEQQGKQLKQTRFGIVV